MASNPPKLSLMCVNCGWAVDLPYTVAGYDIDPATGWDITPGDHAPLCERCADGWKPRILRDADRLALEAKVAEALYPYPVKYWPDATRYARIALDTIFSTTASDTHLPATHEQGD